MEVVLNSPAKRNILTIPDMRLSWGYQIIDLGVSINGGTPTLMVYKGKNPIKMDDLGVPGTLISGHLHLAHMCAFVPDRCHSQLIQLIQLTKAFLGTHRCW